MPTNDGIVFQVPFGGAHYTCSATLKNRAIVALEIADCPAPALEDEWATVAEKVMLLDELLTAGLPWRAVLTCRQSPGLFGAIVEAAEERRRSAVWPWRRPQGGVGGHAAR